MPLFVAVAAFGLLYPGTSSSLGKGSVGLPRRSRGRLASLPCLSPESEAGASFFSGGFESAASPGFDGSCLDWFSVDGDPEDDPEEESGAGAGEVPGFESALGLLPPLVSRGGASVLSIPTGTFSALMPVFGASAPVGSHIPVPSQG